MTCGPRGEPAATPDWIRANVEAILATLQQGYAIGTSGALADLKRVPRRMHWLLWLLAEVDPGSVS